MAGDVRFAVVVLVLGGCGGAGNAPAQARPRPTHHRNRPRPTLDPTPNSGAPHPAIVNRTEIVDQIREAAGRAGFIAGDEAAFVHATVIDVDDTRMSVAVIAGP